MSEVIATVQQAVDRLIADPAYRIQVAVENNYPAVLANYQALRMTQENLGIGTLAQRLIVLNRTYPQQVSAILDVPFIPGRNDITDGAYQQLEEMVANNELSVDRSKVLELVAAGIAGLAQVASTILGGNAANAAADAEEERLAQVAALQAQQAQAQAEQTQRIIKASLIGLAIVGAIVLLVVYIRKRRDK